MEVFSLLKFWRTASVRDIDPDFDSVKKFVHAVDYVSNPAMESTDEEIDNDEDSFFDLVFTGINGHPKENNNSKSVSDNGSSVKSQIKSAPNFRVCFLGFRKSKPEKLVVDDYSTANAKIQTHKLSPKAESKVEEVPVPVRCVSFRYKSLKGSKLQKEEEDSSINDSSKQFARADMGKYLKLMKPLYSRASKRYTDKIRVSEHVSRASKLSSLSMSSPRNSSEEKQGNRVAVFGAVRKRLGKSRLTASTTMNRRDDSLLEKNDGIQGAILHCKRSFSSDRKDCSVLLSRNANEEDLPSKEQQNRWSI